MDIPILKYLDVVIGLAVVMVILSTVVLAIAQMALNASRARARHLERGLEGLIAQIDPAGLRSHARYLARLIQRHPLVGSRTLSYRFYVRCLGSTNRPTLPIKPGLVIGREELAYLLVEVGAGEGPLMELLQGESPPEATVSAQRALNTGLRATGVEDPAATLRAIRMAAVENEREHPEQPVSQWRTDAVLRCAESDFIGQIYQSFDSTMSRVTDAFGSESQLWVSAVALSLVLVLQFDSFDLIRRLSVDDGYRDALVARAEVLEDQLATAASSEELDEILASRTQVRKDLEALASSGSVIDLLRVDDADATERPPEIERSWRQRWASFLGIGFSWVLLSLGAPFWYDMLKNALQLRSRLAKKDDAEREQRQTQTTSTSA